MIRLILGLTILALSSGAQCALYKCEKPNKTVAYSDKPCPVGSQAQNINGKVKVGKSSGAETNLGEEWRNPYYSEISQDSEWRTGSKEAYFNTKADFDGDGMDDSVHLLVSRNNNESAVVVYLSSLEFRAVPLIKETGLYAITGRGLKVFPAQENAGPFKISCRSMTSGCLKKFNDGDEVASLATQSASITYFFKNEKNHPIYYVWDKDEKRFFSLEK